MDGRGRCRVNAQTERFWWVLKYEDIKGTRQFAATAFRSPAFAAAAAASPSVWFPGFVEYMKECRPQAGSVYLSLGDREEKTRNHMMAAVGARIREAHELLKAQGVDTVLELNPGNHFRDADIRTAKAFAWAMTGTE